MNETKTAPLAANATVGVANGVVPTEIDADASDTAEPVPLPLGVTVKVYDVPFVSPDTVQVCEPVGGVVVLTTVQLALGEPEAVLTVYRVATPSAVKVTAIFPAPAFATVGVDRAFVAETAADRADVVDVVPLPVGFTENSYDEPLLSPDTVQLCVPVGAVVVLATTQVVPGEV